MEWIGLFLVVILICIAIAIYLWLTVPSNDKEEPVPIVTSSSPDPRENTEGPMSTIARSLSEDNAKPVIRESWCFVGEDLSGRYCVKVPSDAACTSDRIFLTRGDCELISGSRLVAGISSNGQDFRPLMTMRFTDDIHLRNNDP